MLEELQRRNYGATTIESYIPAAEDFAKYFRKPPARLNREHLREYQAYLLRERKLEPRTVAEWVIRPIWNDKRPSTPESRRPRLAPRQANKLLRSRLGIAFAKTISNSGTKIVNESVGTADKFADET